MTTDASESRVLPGAVGLGWSIVRRGAGWGWRLVQRQAPPALAAGPLGRVVIGGRTAAVLRSAGRDIPPTREALELAYPHATGRLLVLLPDSMENEQVWHTGVEASQGNYGSRLAGLLGWTPVHVHAPAPASDHGRAADLAALLQAIVEHWPEPVESMAVVAHGDGGLAFRAAAGVATWAVNPWQASVRNVVLLDTPHLLAADAGGRAGVGRHIDAELAGVVTTAQVEEAVDPIADASYVVITREARLERSLIGSLLGNVVWWRHRGRLRRPEARLLFPTATLHHVGDASIPLTNHPEVQQALLDWLS